jgi:protein O-GlcNAc transferase
LRFAGSRSRAQLMALMAEVDVALDSFPFAGQTTTCECLWMGVPVVTLAGETHASRVGASILSCVGLAEFVTGIVREYVETAVGVGEDRIRLATLRRGMRERLQECGFTGGRRLSQEIEACFRELWRNWCRENKEEKSQ